MARTLKQLKESIERLIDQQGEEAPVAAFIFTNEDVYKLDDEGNTNYIPLDDADRVLDEIEGMDYIYEKIFECIDDQIKYLNVAK